MKFLKWCILLQALIGFSALASMQMVLASPTVNSAFGSSALIGKVFHDSNGNGYLDNKEQGIPGVRLFTIEGLMIETDAYGRFHVVDSLSINSTNRGSIVLKVDQASFPDGSRLTTENPRVLRLTNAGISKVNFGISF